MVAARQGGFFSFFVGRSLDQSRRAAQVDGDRSTGQPDGFELEPFAE